VHHVKWLLSLAFALATVRAEAQIRRVQPGHPSADVINRALQGQGIGGDPAGVGILGGPDMGGGFAGGRQGQNQQPPNFGPQVPIPGRVSGVRDKDDDGDHRALHLSHLHGHLPSFAPEESKASDARGLRGLAESHPSVRAPTGLSGAGRGFGKWFGAGLAGVIAAIGGIFRGIFGSRPQEKTNPGVKESGSVPLGSNGRGGMWIRH
jgi:hypothetical protein